ncbi:hypothetical protein DYBT9623_04455 [Dyadobacter sp. CECT 9623]|uniref:Uncharacterized protein n=1 Tax=Dyadobacter linearis TaxID=2823330 RepID=A0ABM8UVT7_9BACT|nr:hypothetical protein [Dyadobacter sp. CECT 9623]CAG5072918.1 hypothetical protein DYBT9623_04455 [Dyadobacter sp. CECT 9623]
MESIRIFSGELIDKLLDAKKEAFKAKLDTVLTKDQFAFDRDIIENMIAEFRVDNLRFHFDKVEWHRIDKEKQFVPMDQISHAVRFYIPFTGNWIMLKHVPRNRSAFGFQLFINESYDELIYDLVIGEAEGSQIMDHFTKLKDSIGTNLNEFESSIAEHNQSLNKIAEQVIEKNLQVLDNQKKLSDSIKFPERRFSKP